MIENYFPKNLEEAKKGYDECCERKDQFKEEYKEVFNEDITLHNGEEPHSHSGESEKIKAQYRAIEKECCEKYKILQDFKKAKNADENNSVY